MKDEKMQARIQQALNAELSGLRTSSLQRDQLYLNAVGGYKVKRKLTLGLLLALVLLLVTLTAVAVELLTGDQVVEQYAVPMALENDQDAFTQESFSHEELARLVETLHENGIELKEGDGVMQALANGRGYWEEEALMEICREAFGGLFYEWSIAQKHWFDEMTVQIGFKEKNPYAIPQEGDMTVAEAKALGAKLLQEAYGVSLPVESDEAWKICEWLYAPWTDSEGFHNTTWKFEYVNRRTGTFEYTVKFNQAGGGVEISRAAFHEGLENPQRYYEVRAYMEEKYGSMGIWPMEAWPEFGQLISKLTPESKNQWYYQQAGYRDAPEGSLTEAEALEKARAHLALEGTSVPRILCCQDGERPIYKITLSYHFPGQDAEDQYDAIWWLEMDCMTGEILQKQEYAPGEMENAVLYVPFALIGQAPSFEKTPSAQDQAEVAEAQRRADAYQEYEKTYGYNWYFWPLEAQKDALGGHHHLPEGEEMSREEAIETALQAIEEQKGREALTALGEYAAGAICCRIATESGDRISWEIYVTSDPDTMGNGYRVDFDDPAGFQLLTEIEVLPANAENG